MLKGINIRDCESIYKYSLKEQAKINDKKCIFLSHASVDKSIVVKIGEYIKSSGFNIYLDLNDRYLQVSSVASKPKVMTSCIQEGIAKSDYILCIIADDAFDDKSWCIPNEIGYFNRGHKEWCVLRLSDVLSSKTPEYLKIKKNINSINELNELLKSWNGVAIHEWTYLEQYNKYNGLLKYSSSMHPLMGVVDS